jgi:hypothetical protein
MKQTDKAMKALSKTTPEVMPKAGKRIEVDGKFYRMRRGVLVEIPEEWVGNVTHPQNLRKRDSRNPSGKKVKAYSDDFNERRGTETQQRQKPITDEDLD